ncbi:MAG: hypothetical protein HGA51_06115, partial [Demequinaceae bacterium]|nr:hypothetical protein [Demequinaceae bacterium]
MSVHAHSTYSPSTLAPLTQTIVGEPEVVEDARLAESSDAWLRLKAAATAIQRLQVHDGSIPAATDETPDGAAGAAASGDTAAFDNRGEARALVAQIIASIRALAPAFPHDAEYLAASVRDFERWADEGFGVPDFLDSLAAFQPQRHRVDGTR